MIRRIEAAEIPACTALIRTSFCTVADAFGFTPENAPRFTAFSVTEDRLRWQMQQEHRPMYGYFDGDTVVGYYSLLPGASDACELNNLCVAPAYRHRKIGETLLRHAFAQAKAAGFHRITIGIVEENTVLRTWYERFGFVHTGTKKFDFFPFTCGYMEILL